MELNYVEFVDGEKYPSDYSDLNISDDLNDFNSAGILIPEDVIVVDIDVLTRKQIDAMLDTFDIKTRYYYTDKGCHLYFKKPKKFKSSKEHTCALGFNVEFKDVKFITIKRDGMVSREFINEELMMELPELFMPQRSLESMLGRCDNEGRYVNMVRYAARLRKWSNKNTILTFINEYIFGEEMSDVNFNLILNGVKPKDEGLELGTALGMTAHVMNECKPALYYTKQYWLINGKYTNDERHWERFITSEVPSMPPVMVREIIERIGQRCPYFDDYQEWTIKLPNGVLRKGEFIKTDTFTEFTPFTMPYGYDSEAKCPPALEKFLSSITGGDDTYRQYLIDMFAWSLVINPDIRKKHPKMHIIVGDGGNGKGVLMSLFGNVIGTKNSTSVKMDELKDEKKCVTLRGSLVNLGEDIKNKPMDKDIFSVIKNITALDPITLRDMYEKADNNVMVHSNLIFTSNHLIQAFERGASVERRVVWCPMYGQVAKDLTDAEFDELKSEATYKYLMKLLVESYIRLYNTREFTHSDRVTEFTKQTIDNDDMLGTYLNELNIKEFVYNKPKDIFNAYIEWCEDEGIENNLKQKTFMTELHKAKGTIVAPRKTSAGKTQRIVIPDKGTAKGLVLSKEVDKMGMKL